MKFRSEKGYTGVDIAIAIIVITMFVSLIAVLIYRFNSLSNEMQLKSEAIAIAIDEIENIKKQGFEAYDGMNKNTTEDKEGNTLENQQTQKDGFYRTIAVEDYTDIGENEQKISNLVKRVTVKIFYIFKGEEQTVELSTILSKEN